MHRAIPLACAVVCLSAQAFAQCNKMVVNPSTHKLDCNDGAGNNGDFNVTGNLTVGGTTTSGTSGNGSLTLPSTGGNSVTISASANQQGGTVKVSQTMNAGTQWMVTAPQYTSCAIMDNAICSSSVDASGNPNFVTTAAGVVLPINGGTTPLVMFINGIFQRLSSNVTLTVPSTTNVPQWILAVQDTTNPNMVAGDFLAMGTAPFYQPTAPTCPSPGTALSATNPSFWFDTSTNTAKTCTANGGAYSANPSIVIATVFVDATPKVANIICEPFRLNPYRRWELFGTGTDSTLITNTGTTTIDVFKNYQAVVISGNSNLVHTIYTSNTSTMGVYFYSQNPVMIVGTTTVNVNSLGRVGANGGTGAGAAGGSTGFGGTGGGGGGSGVTSAAGGVGGGRDSMINHAVPGTVANGGGAAGAATPTAGGNGTAPNALPPLTFAIVSCGGASGASGAGDGAATGGNAGTGGGSIYIKAPAILIDTGTTVSANGGNGGQGSGGNAGGGGGGGGGCVILNGGFITVNGTVTVTAGTGGALRGTGTAGGNGSAGTTQQNRLF